MKLFDRTKHVLLASAVCMSLLTPTASANPGTPVKITLEEKAVLTKHAITIVSGRTMVHADDLAALVQGKKSVEKGDVFFTVTGNKTVGFQPNVNKAFAQGKWHDVDQGAVTYGKEVYVPLGWALKKLSYDVAWDAKSRTVEVKKMLGTDGQEGFTVVNDDALTAEEKAFVEQVKQKKGVHKQGNLVVIARGQVPNPGYGLAIIEQKQSFEQLFVYVKLTKPEPGRMYAQVISYPYLVGKVTLPNYTTVAFLDADTKQELFSGE